MSEKRDKQSVRYTDRSNNPETTCAKCEHFWKYFHQCDKVKGTVEPKGWCELFEKK